jgi:hypothetical protein
MFEVIKKLTPRDLDYPERYYLLLIYKRILDGTLYSCFKYQYHDEYIGADAAPSYVAETQRAPCINTGLNIMRSVVEQSVGFLFGEDRFPDFMIEDEATKQWIEDVVEDTHLVRIMQDAVTKGSIGSVGIQLKVLQDRFFPVVHETVFITPTFDPQKPDTLTKLEEKKKVFGKDLRLAGYTIPDDELQVVFWFERDWDDQEETWYHPWHVGAEKEEKFRKRRDDKRSVVHGLGIVPWVWIKNLVGSDNDIDGRCTFEPAIENCIQIDYALSRADRALKYNADPLTVFKIRNPNQVADFVRTSGNAIVVGVEGDAKILEVSGDAAHAILDTVEELKDEAMQAIHGSRADPDKLAVSQSSVAQRMLYLPMVQLASHMRISYGDCGLVPLLKMMLQIAAQMPIKVLGKFGGKPDPSQDIKLTWNDFFPPTPFDQQQVATTMQLLVTTGILSKRTALSNLRAYFDFDDVDDEMAQIKKEQDEDAQRDTDQQVAVIKAKPAPAGGNR